MVIVIVIPGLIPAPEPGNNLSINSTEGGSVTTPGEGVFTYGEETMVDLTATPDAGYDFVEWTGDVSTIAEVEAASTNITMNGDHYSITTNFQPTIEWQLIWSDEFDYEGLPDPTKWDYEEGFIRNKEVQYYTRARLENARVEDGILVIEARKEQWPNPIYNIMEFPGSMPYMVIGNVHWSENGTRQMDPGTLYTSTTHALFHVYAIEWHEDRIDWFFDGYKYHAFTIDDAGQGEDNPFRKPHFLMLDFSLGSLLGGTVDDSIFSQKYLIDYVRVYESKTG